MINQVREFGKDFTIKVVRDIEEFKKLKEVWNEIAQENGSYVPWLNWDWFSLFLKYFLDKDELFILLLSRGEEVIAIAPFLIKNEKFRGLIKTRKIELIGNVHSLIRNFILADSNDQIWKSSITNIIDYFRHEYKKWDIIELDAIPDGNNAFIMLKDVVLKSGLKYRTYFCFNDWYLDGINYDFKEYVRNLPKNLRRNIKRYEKSMQTIGDLRFEMRRDNKNIDIFLDHYDQIRERSWKAVEKDKAFKREFYLMAAEKGWIRLGLLYSGETPVAGGKYLVFGKTVFGLDAVYDQNYEKNSPGTILTSKIIQYAIDNDKVAMIDLGRGDETYKQEWVTKQWKIKGINIFNHTLKGRLSSFLMTRILQMVERNPHLLSAKNRLLNYLK
jgi:hypothetical protein